MNSQASPDAEAESAGRRNPIRSPEIDPALKRDRLLQKVRAARRRLSPAPNAVPRLR